MGRKGKSALRSGHGASDPAPTRGRLPRRRSLHVTALLTAGALLVALAGCGGDNAESQDVSEPSGEFPVEVTTSKFPNRQRLAETTELVLGVENTGEETIPDLAVTIFVDDGADGSFSVRLEDPELADPNRPVWILEHKYPRIEGDPAPKGSSPATVAQTNTFGFGELAPDERLEMVWRVTPVRAGTYTLNYEIAAGLHGKAKAVTSDGSQSEGKFVVTITDKPPKARVNNQGKVETSK